MAELSLTNAPWLALTALAVAATALLTVFVHRAFGKRMESAALVVLVCLPTLYFTVTHAGLIADSYLRFVRPWAAPLATLAAGYVLGRCLSFQSADSRLRAALRNGASVGLTLCLGLAVAGLELGRPLDRMAVLVLVDRSRSIDLVPDAESRIVQELRVAELGMQPGDRIGVLAFGASAVLESPLRTREQQPSPQLISMGRDATDIEQALRRGLSELPADARGKLVLISDGVATRGEASNAIASAVAARVPVDVVPLDQAEMNNIRVVSLSAPSSVSEGETFNLRAVIESTQASSLEVRVLLDGALLLKQDIDVSKGQDVLDLVQRADNVGLKRYELQLSAKNPAEDRLADDNRRSSFVRVRGPSSALVLAQDKARAEPLAEALRSAELHVTSADLFGVPQDVAELSEFDLVVLVDIPAHMLTPAQLGAMAAYVRHLGGGLLLMGSDQTLGPGGYGKTPIEDISPVSFDLKQDRKRASLAEVIVIDYSGSMSMEVGGKTKLELANEASVRSSSLLSSADQLGVMHVDTEIRWTRALSPIDDKDAIAKAIRAVGPGGGGIYVDLGLREAYAHLRAAKTSLKHVLLFADGADAEQMDNSQVLARDALGRSITTSVVSLGQGPDVPKLEQLSRSGGGRFYLIEDARRLPAVFAQETILAARSALNEIDFVPAIRTAGGALRGVDFSSTPQLHGYVVTIPKPRAEVLLDGPERDPLLAVWSVGLGKVGAFTSDYGSRWGQHWTGWSGAAQLFAQLGRSLARDHDDRKVRLRTEASAGSLSVTADVIDERGALDSYRELAVHVAGPGDFLQTLPLEALGPGRYGANMPLERPGAYVVSTVELTSGKLVATGGAELSASDELRPTGTHRGALERIAREGGGQLRDTLAGIFSQRLGLRFAYDDVSSKLLWSSATFLLLMVAFRRLSFPEWLERALRFRSARTAKPNRAHGAQAAVSQVLSSKRKQRQRPHQNPTIAAPLPPPFPVAKPAATVTKTANKVPAATHEPAAPRTLSAAEILLAKRRNRRDS